MGLGEEDYNIYPHHFILRVVSHIPKFGDASKSPAGDTASPSGDAVVSHWRCIISFRDAHPPQETPHLPREMWSHLQITGYVTLLQTSLDSRILLYQHIFQVVNKCMIYFLIILMAQHPHFVLYI
jgi:hypothetical protein